MNKYLTEFINKILRQSNTNEEKSLALISLAETAWAEGDMNGYKMIVDELVKINPSINLSTGFIFSKRRIEQKSLPSIDEE